MHGRDADEGRPTQEDGHHQVRRPAVRILAQDANRWPNDPGEQEVRDRDGDDRGCDDDDEIDWPDEIGRNREMLSACMVPMARTRNVPEARGTR